jgi:hypothetical protein
MHSQNTMIEFCVKDIVLANSDNIYSAIGSVFSASSLKNVHGKETEVSPWKQNKREVKYCYDVSGIQHPFKKFVIRDKVWIVAEQMLHVNDDETNASLENKVKLKCIGSRFISINSTFNINHCIQSNNTYFGVKVRVNVSVPGIAKMTEELLADQARSEVDRFVRVIRSDF